MKRLLSLGHGYSAQALGRLLVADGDWQIVGTTRDAPGAARLVELGVTPVVWPGADLTPHL